MPKGKKGRDKNKISTKSLHNDLYNPLYLTWSASNRMLSFNGNLIPYSRP